MSESYTEPIYNPKCPKCGQLRGYWKEIWLTDVGGSMKEWIPHTCTEAQVAIATSE